MNSSNCELQVKNSWKGALGSGLADHDPRAPLKRGLVGNMMGKHVPQGKEGVNMLWLVGWVRLG